jgi:semaphorin 6
MQANKMRQFQLISNPSPPVRWAGKLILLATLTHLAASLRANSGITDPWGENQRPKLYTDYLTQHSDAAYRFFGNHTHTDYFKLLNKDGQSLLIGARNVIYNISLPYLTENVQQRITWDPLDQDRELCLLKGKSEVDCQNYIRVLAKTQDGRLLVCGTNAYNPKCRYYSHNETHSSVDREFSGKGFCPYDPRHNSTSLYADGELYSATVADFSASDSLIIKDNLRTEQYDFKQLNGKINETVITVG